MGKAGGCGSGAEERWYLVALTGLLKGRMCSRVGKVPPLAGALKLIGRVLCVALHTFARLNCSIVNPASWQPPAHETRHMTGG